MCVRTTHPRTVFTLYPSVGRSVCLYVCGTCGIRVTMHAHIQHILVAGVVKALTIEWCTPRLQWRRFISISIPKHLKATNSNRINMKEEKKQQKKPNNSRLFVLFCVDVKIKRLK